MYKLVFTCCCFLLLTNCFGQILTITEKNDRTGFSWVWPDDSDYYEGSRYLYDEFIVGDLYAEDSVLTGIPLRLNLHNTQAEFVWNDSVYEFVEVSSIDHIIIDDEVFVYMDMNIDTNGAARFAKKWNNQFPQLLTTMNSKFYHEGIDPLYRELRLNRFERIDTHYVLTVEGAITRVTSVKKLITFLGNHTGQLTRFAKKEKICADDPVELLKLLDYYRSLNTTP